MPHVSPTLPNDGETADAADISIPFSLLLAIFNGHIAADNIEPGSLPWSVMSSFSDSIPGAAMQNSANLEKYRDEINYNQIVSGMVWSQVSLLNGQMTAGVYYSTDGVRYAVPEITTHAFTVSKDTYVYTTTGGVMGYTEVANGAATPQLPDANSTWDYKVITDGTQITSVVDMRGLDGAWIPYITVPTNISGGTLNYALYRKVGKLVHFKFKFTLTSAGMGSSPRFTLPVPMATRTAATQDTFNIHVGINDASGIAYPGGAAWYDANNITLYVFNAGSTYLSYGGITSSVPMSWASGDFLIVQGFYEAAS